MPPSGHSLAFCCQDAGCLLYFALAIFCCAGPPPPWLNQCDVAAIFDHWCIFVAWQQMSLMFAELILFHLLLCSLFFPLLMHSDIYFLTSPSNTLFMWWWVGFFTIRVVHFSAIFSSDHFLCNLQQSELTDHMNVFSGEWGWGPQWEPLCWSGEEKNFEYC